MRVLVFGGRDLDPGKVFLWLDENLAIRAGGLPSFVIEGGATGADEGARMWRRAHSIPGRTYEALWVTHGKAAGPIRNSDMLTYGKPEVAVEFPGGVGTKDMHDKIVRANKRGADILLIKVEGSSTFICK